ncbi:MAG: YegS/Rv2252/BmrU family lipid kinase [Bacilli bacterium]|nr:YegS/Rv2252/BmrU family lipid kinase [Bacilli bacterium]
MQNIFIINPTAGKKNISLELSKKILEIDKNAIIHITSAKLDATNYVENFCSKNKEEKLRIFACGGDGTLNEVINGALNFENVAVGCFPSGSGNDFLKIYKDYDFTNIKNQINGKEVIIDLISYNKSYGVNVCNIGFDADVAFNMMKFKKKPFISGSMAYNAAVLYSLLKKTKHKVKIYIDDSEFFDDEMLLCAVSNGICYGGGYYCTPSAKPDDGILDICLVKKVSRFTLLKLIKKYKLGLHISDPRFKNMIYYVKARKIKFVCADETSFSVDGEVFQTKELELCVVPKKIRFILPEENYA